ncbi:hypothetical protein [Pseudomonas frederiksbergensis]|uniref:hypothetical protein n=1 Tax=Pseudomonas frederiksbergensis TaxID=104087 RepID=UPI003D1F092A
MDRIDKPTHSGSSFRGARWFQAGVCGALLLWALGSMAETFQNYDQVVASPLPRDVLWHVIARDGKSKNYTDLIPLDGGTVGIAHFATGGLGALYANMDTDKYFAKSRDTMRKQFAADCRPAGKTGNDTGWGCYSKPWWKQGMQNFLHSDDSKDVQHKAWTQLMEPVIKGALNHDWRSERALAIALSIANSLGAAGFSHLANQYGWNAEKTLAAYAQRSDHTQRRKEALDKQFPPTPL